MIKVLLYAVFFSLPGLFAVTLLFRNMFGYQSQKTLNIVLFCAIINSMPDAIVGNLLPHSYQTPVSGLITLLCILIIFKLNPLNAIASYLVTFAVQAAVMVPTALIFLGFGVDVSSDSISFSHLFIYTLVYSSILIAIAIIIDKKNKHINWSREYEFLSDLKFENYLKEHVILTIHLFFTFFVIVCFGFSALLRMNQGTLNPNFYFFFDISMYIIFIFLYFKLMKLVNYYKKYESMYKYAKALIDQHKDIIKEAEAKNEVS